MRRRSNPRNRVLGIGSWWDDEYDYGVIGILRWRTYASPYLDGWVVKATR